MMFSELFFEVLSEEIPSRMHKDALAKIESYLTRELTKQSLTVGEIKVFITARRIIVCLLQISLSDTAKSVETKGPRVDAKQDAITGFLQKTGKKLEELSIRAIKGKEFYFDIQVNDNKLVETTLKSLLEGLMKHLSWPKSMRWTESKVRWVRPILNILCLLDGKVLDVSYAGINSNNMTQGNRFLSKFFTIKDFADYRCKLHDNHVILEYEERRVLLLNQIDNLTGDLICEVNGKLLDEVVGIVEYPMMILGKIDEQFFSLPTQVVLSVMHHHQRYFAVTTAGVVTHFIATTTIVNDGVIKGHEKVLRARLADAKFFVEQDAKHNLEYYIEHLKTVTFHAKLGNVAEKVKRITALAKYLSVWVPQSSLIHVERAAYLAKADLTTVMVKEFPELQGVMGGHYAKCSGEHPAVYEAIAEHYYPLGPSQPCPTAPTAIAVAIADKVDSLLGLLAVNEQPSGSSDPFAMRRLAIGIIRIIVTNGLQIPVKLLFEKAASLYHKRIYSKKMSRSNDAAKYTKKELVELVLEFCQDKFRIILHDDGIDLAVINAAPESKSSDNFTLFDQYIKALASYLASDNGSVLIATYKRAGNIISKAEKADGVSYLGAYKKRLLLEKAEISLAQSMKEVSVRTRRAMKARDVQEALNALLPFCGDIDNFMDNIKINSSENSEIRKNRLMIISKVRSLFNLVANFDKFCN